MSAPWLKFYPRDWRGDQALRAVSIAARGLWMECLCIMHEAKPYGHLVLNGKSVEGDALARMTGVPVDQVSDLMSELREAGVLSVTGKGVVFSRRMTKDHARAQKGRNAVKKRWSQVSDDVEQSGAPNRYPIRHPITQKPEAREQTEKEKPSVSRKSRGTRWPQGQAVPGDWLRSAQGLFPSVPLAKIEAQARQFVDYWPAVTSGNGVKGDWEATWRNWLRKAFPGLEHIAGGPSVPDAKLAILTPGDGDFEAVQRLRGRPLRVGNSGKATVTRDELERARRGELFAERQSA